ncbi:MAG TPA: hypothetical protein VHB79_32945 [Polyangiaceae bacterium]|nr:hypothetical protein [Polyangiaceae bacterium]
MSDDLNPDARQLVDLARQARTPGSEDKHRIAERLAVPLAAGVAVGGATAAAKAAGAQSLGAALLSSWGVKIAALVVVGATATALVVSHGSSSSGSHGTTPASVSAPAPALPVVPPPQVEPAPVSPEALPERAVEPLLPQKSGGALAPHAPRADELMEEAALLHQAQSAWRAGQSAEALKLANQHAQRFPRSQLANERDVLRVLSLCKLGQKTAAKQVGARLLKSAKGSPWYQSVADSCAAE